MGKKKTFEGILSILKPAFTLIFAVIAAASSGQPADFLYPLFEVAILFFLTELLLRKNRVVGHCVSGILYFLLNAQLFFKVFANTYLTMVMVTNVRFLSDLSDKMFLYVICIGIMVAVCFAPTTTVLPDSVKLPIPLAGVIALELMCGFFVPTSSPALAYFQLIQQGIQSASYSGSIEQNDPSSFLKQGIDNAVRKPKALGKHPNVVLIFCEGLSQNIIDDDRNIMPNVAKYQQKSLSFTNYYNHSFATLRGLIGQLYSGYQLNDLDENHLVSIQKILHDEGYFTTFIDTEPDNEAFWKYLYSFGFDELISEKGTYTGTANSISDLAAFERLEQRITEDLDREQPFFTAIYTFGTHANNDSPDEVFDDGSLSELNKFYNFDVQFGKFMEWFESSPAFENTLLVFTTDHATYADKYFTDAFPDYPREYLSIDRVPLFFYFNGVEPDSIDAGGRNTLGLAPTILDYLDISRPNYFLGSSLFLDKNTPTISRFSTLYQLLGEPIIDTDDGNLQPLSKEEQDEINDRLKAYFAAKLWDSDDTNGVDSELLLLDACTFTVSEDHKTMTITVTAENLPETYDEIQFAVWTEKDAQDDLVWYDSEYQDGVWTETINLEDHDPTGVYHMHAYGKKGDAKQTFIFGWATEVK